jgi:hypothetical protein
MLLDLFRPFRAWGWGSACVGLHPTLTDDALSGLGSCPLALKGRNLPAMGEAHRLAHQRIGALKGRNLPAMGEAHRLAHQRIGALKGRNLNGMAFS